MFASMIGTVISVFVMVMILAFIIGGIVASASEPKTVEIDDNSILRITLGEQINERTSNDPFSTFNFETFEPIEQIGLYDFLTAIESAAEDEHIKGIYLDVGQANMGFGYLEEIRNAIHEFKASGKFVYAFGEMMSQKSYYIASVADKVYLHPAGGLEFKGLSSQVLFFKGALEKLEIEPQVIRRGKFKSAVEPFERSGMSDANREQIAAFIQSIWNNVLDGIGENRSMSREQLNATADELVFRSSEKALEYQLIDHVAFEDEVISAMKSKIHLDDDAEDGEEESAEEEEIDDENGDDEDDEGEDDDVNFVKIHKYYASLDNEKDDKSLEKMKNRIAIVYAHGEVVDGEGSDDNIGSARISKAIRKARKNDKVKAVVLRVNSPGGSALASDVIWREIELTKAEKPVVVSMGNLAASGGYYISCGADKIWANENTITGSIGVFGIIPNMQGLFNNKLGITLDTVNTNKNAEFATTMRPLTEFEVQVLEELIENVYVDFVGKVSEGRDMTIEEVQEIAGGRVWSGTDAVKNGLVDEIGGFKDAVSNAAELAGLENYSIKEYPESDDPFKKVMQGFSSSIQTNILKDNLGEHYEQFEQLQSWITERGILTRMLYDIQLY